MADLDFAASSSNPGLVGVHAAERELIASLIVGLCREMPFTKKPA